MLMGKMAMQMEKFMENNNHEREVRTGEEHICPEKPGKKKTSFKTLPVFLLIVVIGLLGCLQINRCSHEWVAATCLAPQTCSNCAKTQGDADITAHKWTPASCDSPKVCLFCGTTEGDALGHQWKSATLAEHSICAVCAEVNLEDCAIAARMIEGTWQIFQINLLGEIYSRGNEIFDQSMGTNRFAFSTVGMGYILLEGMEAIPIPWGFVEESEDRLSYVMSADGDTMDIFYFTDPDSPWYGKLAFEYNEGERLDGPNYILCEKIADTVETVSEVVEEPKEDVATIVIELPEVHKVDAAENPLFSEMGRLMGIDGLKDHASTVCSYEEDLQVRLDNAVFLDQLPVLEMGDGSKLQLPMTYKALQKTGWRLEGNPEDYELSDPLPAETYCYCTFVNRKGKTIEAKVANASSEAVKLNDAWITLLILDEEHDDSYCVNGISKGASVEEILDVFGMPYDIAYYQLWSGEYTLMFYYTNEARNCHLQFYIDPETEQLFRITCQALPD